MLVGMFFVLLIFCTISFVCLILLKKYRLKSKNFSLEFHYSKYKFFNKEIAQRKENIYTKILADLVYKKLQNNIKLYSYLSREELYKLKLKTRPTFCINFFEIKNYIKIYQDSLWLINDEINLILLNFKNEIFLPKNINAVYLEENKLNMKEIKIINNLNLNKIINKINNKIIQKISNNSKFNVRIQNNDLMLNFEENLTKICDFKINLPKTPYPYFMIKEKDGVCIKNSFNETVLNVCGQFNCKVEGYCLMFKIKRENEIKILLNEINNPYINLFKIKLNGNSKLIPKLEKLRKCALAQICDNMWNLEDKKQFKGGVNLAVKMAILTHKYFEFYTFIIAHIFNINIDNGILHCRPNNEINFDFDISYESMGEIKTVKYVANSANKKNFSSCLINGSHKIGGVNNCAHEF